VLGSPSVLTAAALFASLLAARRSRPAASGFLSGVAVAFDHRAILVAPLLAFGPAPAWRRVVAGFVMGYGLLVLPVAVLDPGGWLASFGSPHPAEPGIGLANALAYWGRYGSPVALSLGAGLVGAAVLALVAKGRLDTISGATIASLSAALLVGGSVATLGLPLAFLGLGSLGEGGDEGSPG
jgi:hypothetical protein